MACEKELIVGVWAMLSQVYEDADTGETMPVFGEHPKGRQIATKGGCWIALATAENRPVRRTIRSGPRRCRP